MLAGTISPELSFIIMHLNYIQLVVVNKIVLQTYQIKNEKSDFNRVDLSKLKLWSFYAFYYYFNN